MQITLDEFLDISLCAMNKISAQKLNIDWLTWLTTEELFTSSLDVFNKYMGPIQNYNVKYAMVLKVMVFNFVSTEEYVMFEEKAVREYLRSDAQVDLSADLSHESYELEAPYNSTTNEGDTDLSVEAPLATGELKINSSYGLSILNTID